MFEEYTRTDLIMIIWAMYIIISAILAIQISDLIVKVIKKHANKKKETKGNDLSNDNSN